ncbi:MAG: hypothetical protein V5788_10845 [Shewanella sp.]
MGLSACGDDASLDLMAPQIMASSRITFAMVEDPSVEGVSFTSYSVVTDLDDLSSDMAYERRHAVTAKSQ